jgi:hypothetical protein
MFSFVFYFNLFIRFYIVVVWGGGGEGIWYDGGGGNMEIGQMKRTRKNDKRIME